MTTSTRLKLPFIAAGQAQKEWVHNEALQILDTLTCAIVEEPPRNDPPANAAEGSSYIVGSAPTGIWAGKASQLATMSSGGWRYLPPADGVRAMVRSTRLPAQYLAGAWETGVVRATAIEIGGEQVLSAQGPAIATPAGGATIDAEARTAVAAILAALRAHGLIAV